MCFHSGLSSCTLRPPIYSVVFLLSQAMHCHPFLHTGTRICAVQRDTSDDRSDWKLVLPKREKKKKKEQKKKKGFIFSWSEQGNNLLTILLFNQNTVVQGQRRVLNLVQQKCVAACLDLHKMKMWLYQSIHLAFNLARIGENISEDTAALPSSGTGNCNLGTSF